MAKSKAKRAHKRKQGRQWIVCTWDAQRGLWVESAPMDYWRAVRAVREWDQK